jgi:HD-GYP domain-containing protein (c-di-GMP phosphodiesterase class II)
MSIDSETLDNHRTAALMHAIDSSLQQSLVNPMLTVAACSRVLGEALRSGDPALIRSWVRYERAQTTEIALLEVLEMALAEELNVRRSADLIQFFDLVRTEARLQLAVTPEGEPADLSAIVTGILIGIAAYDQRLYKHCISVGELAKRLAIAAGWTDARVSHVRNAGRVHEIGRIVIDRADVDSTEIYNEASRLERIRTLLATVRPLELLSETRSLADTVYGMYVGDISAATPEMHVLRVCDAFISMCDSRPYRQALSPHDALATLLRDADPRYDARFVDLLCTELEYPTTRRVQLV